jgi:methionyl-tRNA synthetase
MTPETTAMVQQAMPYAIGGGMIALLVILGIREMVWKGIALWKAGTKKQMAWFICMFIFNTAGILPILYLIFRQKKGK